MANPLKVLNALAEKQFDIEQKILQLTADLKQANLDLVEVAEHQIPELMEDLEVAELKLKSGLTVTVEKKVHTKKLTNQKALAHLIAAGESGLIKADLVIAFGKSESDEREAAELMQRLVAQDFQVKRDEHVNPQTLAKWLRERMSEGEDVDFDLFGAHERTVSKIALPKK